MGREGTVHPPQCSLAVGATGKQSDPAAIPLKSLTNGDYERKDGEQVECCATVK